MNFNQASSVFPSQGDRSKKQQTVVNQPTIPYYHQQLQSQAQQGSAVPSSLAPSAAMPICTYRALVNNSVGLQAMLPLSSSPSLKRGRDEKEVHSNNHDSLSSPTSSRVCVSNKRPRNGVILRKPSTAVPKVITTTRTRTKLPKSKISRQPNQLQSHDRRMQSSSSDSTMSPSEYVKSVLRHYLEEEERKKEQQQVENKEETANSSGNTSSSSSISSLSTTSPSGPGGVIHEHEYFFTKPTEEQMAAYNTEVVDAVRRRDIPKLQTIRSSGQTLNCCNRFGESLLHMACRRGYTEVVSFLLHEAKVPITIRDDYGRTPLHDACWTPQPNYELMDTLLRLGGHDAMKLLLVSDVRGHVPFDYARREHWGQWNKFLSERVHLMMPPALVSSSSDRPSSVHRNHESSASHSSSTTTEKDIHSLTVSSSKNPHHLASSSSHTSIKKEEQDKTHLR